MSKIKLYFGLAITTLLCAKTTQCFEKPEDTSISISLQQLRSGKINRAILHSPHELGEISLCHSNGEFRIDDSKGSSTIQRCYLDKELRGISKQNLAKLIAMGAYFSVNKFEGSEEYSLKLKGRLNGGGPFGAAAGFWVGKLLTHLVVQTGIAVVSGVTFLVCPPAAPVVFMALENTLAPAAEIASNIVGAGVGIAGAVATGPI